MKLENEQSYHHKGEHLCRRYSAVPGTTLKKAHALYSAAPRHSSFSFQLIGLPSPEPLPVAGCRDVGSNHQMALVTILDALNTSWKFSATEPGDCEFRNSSCQFSDDLQVPPFRVMMCIHAHRDFSLGF